MKKTIRIEGMSCAHCAARVERALGSLPGVTARVNLGEKTATVESDGAIDDKLVANAIADAGYTMIA